MRFYLIRLPLLILFFIQMTPTVRDDTSNRVRQGGGWVKIFDTVKRLKQPFIWGRDEKRIIPANGPLQSDGRPFEDARVHLNGW